MRVWLSSFAEDLEMSYRNGNARLASGIVAGIAGGLVASWIMNEFMEKGSAAGLDTNCTTYIKRPPFAMQMPRN